MTMVSEPQVTRLLGATLAEEIERQERDDDAIGPEPEQRVRRFGAAARPADAELRVLLDGWFREYAPMVRRVVGRQVRLEDADLIEDLAQDVWVEAWQYLLRGNEVVRPAGLLARMARSRVSAHYRSARVRRETLTDFQENDRAVDRLVSWLGASA